MPLYEYECDAGHRFELIRKFSDPPLEECPTCGAPVHKLFSSPAIQFKGSGFYITDYAKKDSGAPSGEAKAETASTDKDKGTSVEKGEKTEKAEKSDKGEKSGKSEKTEKSPPQTDRKTSSGGDAAPAATSTSGKKDK